MYHPVDDRTGDLRHEAVPAHGVALFEAHLRHLRANYRVVPAAELPGAVAGRRRGERFPAAITFDDDLAVHADKALPVLRRLGLTATFFLSGASLDRPFSFWWERLQRAVDGGVPVPSVAGGSGARPISAAAMRDVADRVIGLGAAERTRWSDALLEELGGELPGAGMRSPDVLALVEAGMTVGFHTRRHDTMPLLDDGELEAALVDGRAELEALAGEPLTVIGYPYGWADGRVGAAARAAGFAVGYTTRAEAVTPSSDRMLLGRLNPSYRSAGHFALQGLFALLRAR